MLLAAIVVALATNAVLVHGDCGFGVDNPLSVGCVHYDLSALQKSSGYNASAEDNMATYLLNICGDIDKGSLPSSCASQPSSPAYQMLGKGCVNLGLLSTQTAYPVDPNNATAGVRVVYYNGGTGNLEDVKERMDYGAIGIGDAEQGQAVNIKDVPPDARAITIDFICDPSAGAGQPTDLFEFPTYTYRATWRSAHACPTSTATTACPAPPYEASWRSLSFRPVPKWFDDVKFGIFLHWGMFSVPAFKSEWYWHSLMTGQPAFVEFHNRVYGCSGVQPDKFPCTGPTFSYADFEKYFKAELYDPDAWATLFKNSGARYVVLTSKHHEGWCNWPSAQHWNWNSMDVGPHRDLVGELTDSVRAAGLHMGLYHSLREWYNPIFLEDNANNCTNPKFVDEILLPTLKDITTRYKPEVIWADGASGDNPCTRDSTKYWKAPEFMSWLYNESPVTRSVLVNARWGTGSGGDYNTGPDRYTPGKKVPEKWESCFTVQRSSWGYDRTEDISSFFNTTALIYQLVDTVSCNGNLLLNIGPTADGRILPAFEERLLQMGDWLKVNGEAIYGTKPWTFQNDTIHKRVWYTQSKASAEVYAISFDWPANGEDGKPGDIILTQIKDAPSSVSVTMLGVEGTLASHQAADGFHITVPPLDGTRLPCQHAWVFKFSLS